MSPSKESSSRRTRKNLPPFGTANESDATGYSENGTSGKTLNALGSAVGFRSITVFCGYVHHSYRIFRRFWQRCRYVATVLVYARHLQQTATLGHLDEVTIQPVPAR